jgi:hypothetical protein
MRDTRRVSARMRFNIVLYFYQKELNMAAQFFSLLANAKNKRPLKRASPFLVYMAAPRKCGAKRNLALRFRDSLHSGYRAAHCAGISIRA